MSYTENRKNALFLDRDGVINRQVVGGYVTRAEDFEFLPGVLDALAACAGIFGRIFIVTNQQGIKKGLFSEDDLKKVHAFMMSEIEKKGGRIDKIYFCPDLETENSRFRKPATGMGELALAEFPDVDPASSVMAGDFVTDMQFGRALGFKTVFLTNGKTPPDEASVCADEMYADLADFVKQMTLTANNE